MLLSTSSGTGRDKVSKVVHLVYPKHLLLGRMEPRVLVSGRLILPRPFNSAVRPAERPLVGVAEGSYLNLW